MFKSRNGNGGGGTCANTVPEMGWDVVSLPGIPANPETGAYDFEEVS